MQSDSMEIKKLKSKQDLQLGSIDFTLEVPNPKQIYYVKMQVSFIHQIKHHIFHTPHHSI
jgi:hypothetical protein